MLRRAAVTALMLVFATSAHALNAGGWEVDAAPDKDSDCTLQKSYKDTNGGDASIAVLFAKNDNTHALGMVLAVGYEKWAFDKDQKQAADLVIDDTVEQRGVEWIAGAKDALRWVIFKPDPILQSISQGKTMSLRFDGNKDGASTFDIANLGQALAAAIPCVSQMK